MIQIFESYFKVLKNVNGLKCSTIYGTMSIAVEINKHRFRIFKTS